MHASSLKLMEYCLHAYCKGDGSERVLDVGSLDVNGTFRALFAVTPDKPGLDVKNYTGADIVSGLNVDIVMGEYSIPVQDGCFDVIISGNVVEHVKLFWLWAEELKRVLSPGGILILGVPSPAIGTHRYPVDCWRFLEDGMRTLLADWLKLDVLEVVAKGVDIFGVARKREARKT